MAEGLDSENIKKAIRKSRVVFNRGGADEQQAEPGACHPRHLGAHRPGAGLEAFRPASHELTAVHCMS